MKLILLSKIYLILFIILFILIIIKGANPLQTVKALHEAEEFPGYYISLLFILIYNQFML